MTQENNPRGGLLPSALQQWNHLIQRVADKEIILFLAYDGTLTPTVPLPEMALLSNKQKQLLCQLSQHYLVSIASGRALADQVALLDIDNIYYVSNHGFEIKAPIPYDFKLEKGNDFIAKINNAHRSLSESLGKIKGIFIENKRYSLSVHYRLVKSTLVSDIEASIDDLTKNSLYLKKYYAKKVFEIRPNIDWNKGKAILWLMQELNLNKETIFPIYIGDDITDESAFEAILNQGVGIFVSDYSRPTYARYCLKNIDEVWQFLFKLIKLKKVKM